MVDIPGDSTTTRSISVGESVSDQLEVTGDHDWFRITLTAGQSITISLNGITLEDPYLRIRDSNGNLIYENDDISSGVVRDSQLSFSATYSGTYYIDVGAWNEDYTGTYTLAVTTYTPPPLATYDQIANQLVEGYWNGDDHHFNVTQGGSISVNLTALTAAGQNLARNALALWGDIIGVTFNEVTSGGQITFDDNQEGAFAEGVWSGGITTSAHVNVSSQWLTDYGTSLTGYAAQAYIHEVGHALGLGHAGNYNDTARYPFDALFQNDSWATSIMSYFDQQENTYFAGQGFQSQPVMTPMVADIVAMSTLYGLSTTTRTGDTVYGVNSNAGRSIFDVNAFSDISFTVLDSGGIDTFDYSTVAFPQVINLNPETFSFVGNRLTISIARGTIIENAFGGTGDDTIYGNSANNILNAGQGSDTIDGGAGNDTINGGLGNDILTGGPGADLFIGSIAEQSSTNIMDFSLEDKLVFTDANLATFSFDLVGNALFFSGGTGAILLHNIVSSTLVASASAGGGVQLEMVRDVANDFNGDGRSDVLWRNETSGVVTTWLGQANGSFVGNSISHDAGTSWTVVGTGDFNGDGRDDVLWRDAGGTVTNWLGNLNGSFTGNTAYHVSGSSWTVAGTGDFNGDDRDDILWRNSDGIVTSWAGQADGSFVGNTAYHVSGSNWTIAGTGDFNGDGRDDVLWRNSDGIVTSWAGQVDGSFIGNTAYHVAGSNWAIAGTGDFNGDGHDDVLWRNSDGIVTYWLGHADGGFVGNTAFHNADNSWNVVGTGDFNGDGRDDILWRQQGSGVVTDWLGQSDGSFVGNFANAYHDATTDWHVQPADLL